MTRIDSDIIRHIQISYERGVPLADIAKTYKVSRQLVSKYARKYAWIKHTSKTYKSHLKIENESRRDFKRDDQEDNRLINNHLAEWQLVRLHLQSAIDFKDKDKAELARHYAETLLIIQNCERTLRSFRTKGRLKITKLNYPSNNSGTTAKANPLDLPSPITLNQQRITIKDLFGRYQTQSKHLARSTISHWGKAIHDLIEFVGHNEANLVDKDTAIRWKDHLLAKGKSIKTIESGYLGAARASYNYGIENGLVAHNPFTRIKLPKNILVRRRSKGFTNEEARTILKSALLLKRGGEKAHVFNLKKWGPWLCAFTGARIGEICQLRKEDIIYRDNIWCVHLTPSAGSIKTKTDRLVPLHPQLIKLGFLKFVESHSDGCLFSYNGEQAGARDRSKFLSVWVRSIGIADKDISPNHAWRHRFKSLCRQYGIPVEYQNAITGHAHDKRVAESYGDFPISALYREVLKLPRIII